MLERKLYKRPPLVEVFTDLSFNDDLPWDALKLADFYDWIGGEADFPERREPDPARRTPHGKSPPRISTGSRRRQSLWQFLSADGNTIVQVGRHTLVFNQLPPYYGWEKFRVGAERVVRSYLATWPPGVVEFAGLHYIDIIDIPGDSIALAEYFNLYPVLPQALLERPVSDLTLACEMAGDREDEVLRISFRQEDSGPADRALFRLQWDYLLVEPRRADAAEILRWLEGAHSQTSTAFRSSLTEKCEQLFEPGDPL